MRSPVQIGLKMAAAIACCSALAESELPIDSLPAGAISSSEMSGVKAEICRDHLVDPASVALRLPDGFRLRTAEEFASKDPTLASLLQLNPAAKDYAVGSLCFLLASKFVVDGVPLRSPKPMAFWWVAASGPTQANMQGKANWIQIGSWYSKGNQRFGGIRQTDPMAEFTNIVVKQVSPNAWRLSLMLPTETVTATVRTTSPSTASKNRQPAFMSVLLSGDSAGQFIVFRYQGHHHRQAEASWSASGSGAFSTAFALPNENASFETIFQERWTAQSGLYRFANSDNAR
jgi:hypothetical protein